MVTEKTPVEKNPIINLMRAQGKILVTKPILDLQLKEGFYNFRNWGKSILVDGGRNQDFKNQDFKNQETI